jgi:hypothetical protein
MSALSRRQWQIASLIVQGVVAPLHRGSSAAWRLPGAAGQVLLGPLVLAVGLYLANLLAGVVAASRAQRADPLP